MKKTILFLATLLGFAYASAQVKIGENPTNIIPCVQLQINGGKSMNAIRPTDNPDGYTDFDTFTFYEDFKDECSEKEFRGARVGIGTTWPHSTLDVVSKDTQSTEIGLRNYSRDGKYAGHDWYISSLGTKNAKFAGSLMLWDSSAWTGLNDEYGCNRFIIDPFGRIGMGGIYEPQANLEIRNSDFRIQSTSIALTNEHRWILKSNGETSTDNPQTPYPGDFIIRDDSTDTDRIVINTLGYVGIGSPRPQSKLEVNGEIQATAVKGPSDIRFKKNIKPLENSLEKIAKLKGHTYQWRQEEFPDKKFKSGTDMGLIAQEVEKVYPEVVYTADDEMKSKSIDYSRLVPALIEAIKELQKEVEELKSQMPYQKR